MPDIKEKKVAKSGAKKDDIRKDGAKKEIKDKKNSKGMKDDKDKDGSKKKNGGGGGGGKKDKKDKKLVEEFQKKISPEYLNNEKFNPKPNPLFSPSPLTSPTSSTDNVSLIKSEHSNESGNKPTPAELQGFAAAKYVPSPGYAHLDPSKSANAHSAFKQLQRVVEGTANGDVNAGDSKVQLDDKAPLNQAPQEHAPRSQAVNGVPAAAAATQPLKQQLQMPQQPVKGSFEPPRNESANIHYSTNSKQPTVQQQSNMTQQRVSPNQRQQQQQQQPQIQQQQQTHPQAQKPSINQHQQQTRDASVKNKPVRSDGLKDGPVMLDYYRALWSYSAQIPSELSFKANDTLAIINKQPDGWWYAELVDPTNTGKKRRGLVPGNYMTPAK